MFLKGATITMGHFELNNKQREELANMELTFYLQNSHKPNKKALRVILCVGLAMAIGPWIFAMLTTGEGGVWIAVAMTFVGLFFTAIALFGPGIAKRQRNDLEKDFARIESGHGGLDKAVKEVQGALAQGDVPAYKIKSGQCIVAGWLVGVGRAVSSRLVNLSDIVAIMGIHGAGTYIILADGEVADVMFGDKAWGETFGIFKEANPHILTNDDAVVMSDGQATDAITAYRKRDFAAINRAYETRKKG